MPGELIITNGDSAAALLREAGIGAGPDDAIMPWRDVLHEGPVEETIDLGDLSQRRAAYLFARGWGDKQKLIDGLKKRDALLARNEDFDDVTLWFEHDLYDQLQLLQILDWFAAHWRDDGRVFLVQADDYLGMQTPDTIGRFTSARKPVSGLQLSMARVAWAAFRHDTPEPWARLLSEDLAALPFLKPAVLRMLEELPSAHNGLSRVEDQILRIIDGGVTQLGRSFGAYMRTEDANFLGDASYFDILDGLTFCARPLISKDNDLKQSDINGDDFASRRPYFEGRLRLTPFGTEVLSGRADHASANTIDRWWGGTHLTNGNLWRWNSGNGVLVGPGQT